ncbi:DUF2285 domain-containing protein [Sphingobium sp.]|uniref:DNA -binding domain-containing protein n=1 Tax=Sphingobium sp. TaxID=1912891 RepID=UPI0025F351BD|nr:DUF2285 domain-containing protein [Sphingobium sp.]
MPIWTAAANPRLLTVVPARSGPALDLARIGHRAARTGDRRHVLLHLSRQTLQLDGLDGALDDGPRRISALIDFGRNLEPQLESVRRLDAFLSGREPPTDLGTRFGRLVEALRVGDAIAAGASQRAIGLGIYRGDWPGDGEHLKSRVRRMIPLAAALVRAGPRGVLAERF